MMTPFHQPAVHACPTFAQLRDRGRDAMEAGRLEEALRLFERAEEVARHERDNALVDLAFCNRSAALIHLGRQDEVKAPLRDILMRNQDRENCFIAAYNLSRAHTRDKASKKALFYARIARDRAFALGRSDWLCSSHNQIANCLMDESYFEEASLEYERALALEAEEGSLLHASLVANLGYCQMMLGRLDEGIRCSFKALRRMRRLGADLYKVWPHLDLCYAYLELGRWQRARRHGEEALALAERSGDPDRTKTCLFLLGETARAAGDAAAAHDTFTSLQRRFYPQSPEIVDLMVAVEMRQVVNLRA